MISPSLLALSVALLVPAGPDDGAGRSLIKVAAEAPSFDCGSAASAVERLICGNATLAALDRRLAARFADALDLAGTGPEQERLRAEERDVLAGREACAAETDPAACVKALYLKRLAALVARYELEAPAATATYACNGEPATVDVSFYDTELPSARIAYGDTVDTGTIAMSGSGSKYDAALGGSIWLKGDDMMFTLPDGREIGCSAG